MDAASEELCQVVVRITQQSPDISQGVDQGKGLHLSRSRDQGLMFGFASNETEDSKPETLMPLPAALAQLLTSKMSVRQDGSLPWA